MERYCMRAGLTRFFSGTSNERGFSLIELSVVISVAATVAVGFLSWTQPASTTNAAKTIETKERIERIATAIEAFRVQQKRLPCPADPLMREDNTRASGTNDYENNFGIEDLDTKDEAINGITTFGVDCPDNVGTVPVNSLELESEYMEDAWGGRFVYHVSNNLCGSDAGTAIVSVNESRLRGCTEIDYASRVGNITVNDTTRDLTNTAAYVILSHGANGYGAFLPSGVQKPFTAASDNEKHNIAASPDNTNVNSYIKADTSPTFDDIIFFKTRIQVERLTSGRSRQLLTYQQCASNSNTLDSITFSDTAALTDNIDNNALGGNTSGEEVALGVLLALQRACIEYAEFTPPSTWTIDGTSWNPQCPGDADYTLSDTNDKRSGACQCPSGNWNSC